MAVSPAGSMLLQKTMKFQPDSSKKFDLRLKRH